VVDLRDTTDLAFPKRPIESWCVGFFFYFITLLLFCLINFSLCVCNCAGLEESGAEMFDVSFLFWPLT